MKSRRIVHRLSLGLDLSTQGLSAAVVDIDSASRGYECSLDFIQDTRTNGFGIQRQDYLVPPRVEGEADQPPKMFFAALDALFENMKHDGIPLGDIVVINDSGQQHGHVYLNRDAHSIFAGLREQNAANSDLVSLLDGCLAYGLAPIWMTSNTLEQAKFMRDYVGGKERMITLSGSNVPLRFTGPVIRRVAQQFPAAYRQTATIHLISSLIPAILNGNSSVPVDFGNACGTSLMSYLRKKWSGPLIQAASKGVPGGAGFLKSCLPSIVPPDTVVGTIAAYFSQKYGFNPACQVIAGSGDNPQSKVPVTGDLLSLGSSLVNMISTNGKMVDLTGLANAMYDGVGRPFMFSCRTNGALVWDQVRALYGMEKNEYGPAEQALQKTPVAQNLVFWQPRVESFPPSGNFDLTRINGDGANLGSDYSGLIETTLAAVYYHSRHFTRPTNEPIYVTGGATGSSGILQRIAAIWNRPVISIENAGADLGAAVAGAKAIFNSENIDFDIEQFSQGLLKTGNRVQPSPEAVAAFHNPGGFLDKFAAAEAKIIESHPFA